MSGDAWERERREREVVALERIGTGLLRLAAAAEAAQRVMTMPTYRPPRRWRRR